MPMEFEVVFVDPKKGGSVQVRIIGTGINENITRRKKWWIGGSYETELTLKDKMEQPKIDIVINTESSTAGGRVGIKNSKATGKEGQIITWLGAGSRQIIASDGEGLQIDIRGQERVLGDKSRISGRPELQIEL